MKEEQKKIFADRLGILRTQKKLSQEELAEALSIDRGTIAKYETQKRIPSFEHLTIFANYFNTTTDYLLGLSEIQSNDTKLKAVCKYTGLSEEAVKSICNCPKYQKDLASEIIESEEFKNILTYFCDADINYNFIYPSAETITKGVIAAAGLKINNYSFDNIPPEFAKALSLVGAMGLEPMYKQKLCEEIIELFEKHLKEGK